jgi:hypothetical protein
MQTYTHVTTIEANDIRVLVQHMGEGITTITAAFSTHFANLDLDELLLDLSSLILNSAISSVDVEFALEGELVCAYRYVISSNGMTAFGPSASEPPLFRALPAGTTARIVAWPNPEQTDEHCQTWFRRVKWEAAERLRLPDGAEYQTYGGFSSGRLGLEKQRMVSPRFDQPTPQASQPMPSTNRTPWRR